MRFAVTPRRASSCTPLRLVTTSQSYARASTGSSPSGSTRINSQRTASCPSASTRATSSSRVTSTRIHQLHSERRRVVACASLDPRPVLRRDEPGQDQAVVVRRDWSKAATADSSHDRALGLHPPARLRVVGRGHEMLVARPHLKGEGTLARLGQHLPRLEAVPDFVAEPEPVEPARGEHDRVEPALATLAQARVDVAAQRLDRERRIAREQLRLPPNRSRPDAHARSQLRRAAERVAWVVAREECTDRQPLRIRGGQVLRRVDRDVDPPLEQRLLDLLDEDAARTDLAERARAVTVARGRDRHERDVVAATAYHTRRELRLGEREPRAARPDANEHSRSSSRWRPAGSAACGRGHARTPSAPAPGAAGHRVRAAPSPDLVLETEEVAHDVCVLAT